MSPKSQKQNKGLKNGSAGVCAGVLTKSTVQPLDFLRTRLQIHDVGKNDYALIQTIRDICKNEGISSLYRGLSANLIGSGVNWGIYFGTYETIKNLIRNNLSSDSNNINNNKLSSMHHFIAGWLSGITAITITNPVWCVKTRLQIQNKYNGLFDCFRQIYVHEGIHQFYRGLGPAYLVVLNPALQFTFYEKLKTMFTELHLYYNDENGDSNLGSTDFLIMGAMAKMMSSCSVYPIQLVRTRLFQTVNINAIGNNNVNVVTQNKYFGVCDCIKRIALHEGINGFYKGLTINLVKTVPSSALTFMFYENTMKILNHYNY